MGESETELIDLVVRLPRRFVEATIMRAASTKRDASARRLALAKWMLASRRRRSKALGKIRLGEPTWDIILDLYVADREERRVDVSGLCLASGVAPTTALRYVDLLVAAKLVTKIEDIDDGRRAFINMGGVLRGAIDKWLDQAEAALSVAGWTTPSKDISDQE